MLSSAATSPSQISYGNPRQIVAATNVVSTVMYTVPSGKKFQGTIYSNNVGQQVSITPAGGVAAAVQLPSISTAPIAPALPVTLVAGSIVTCLISSNFIYLIGVETDA